MKQVSAITLAVTFCVFLSSCGNSWYDGEEFHYRDDSGMAPGKNEEVRRENRELVEALARKLPAGLNQEVSGITPSQCEGTPYAYRVSKQDDGLHMDLRVRFIFSKLDSATTKRQLLDTVDNCLPRIQTFFKRTNVSFGLEYDTNDKPTLALPPHREVELYSSDERSSARTFNISPYKAEDKACLMMAHEFGHHLGLPDEYYEESTCRTADAASQDHNPWSLMDNEYYGWDRIELFPRHMKMWAEHVNHKILEVTTQETLRGDSADKTQYMLFYLQEGRLYNSTTNVQPNRSPYCTLTLKRKDAAKPELPSLTKLQFKVAFGAHNLTGAKALSLESEKNVDGWSSEMICKTKGERFTLDTIANELSSEPKVKAKILRKHFTH
jgi:M6 family metalloprotease-like protein